jgi:hypothetical protein
MPQKPNVNCDCGHPPKDHYNSEGQCKHQKKWNGSTYFS